MRIDEIGSNTKYRIDEQFQNLQILGVKFGNFLKYPKFYNFGHHQISIIEKLLK